MNRPRFVPLSDRELPNEVLAQFFSKTRPFKARGFYFAFSRTGEQFLCSLKEGSGVHFWREVRPPIGSQPLNRRSEGWR